jgi:hypothetical protein
MTDNVVNLKEYKAERESAEMGQWLDMCDDMENEIHESMAVSVSHLFVDRMVNHYGVSPTLIIAQIMTGLISRNIHELTKNGDEGAKEVFALMSHLGQAFCEDFDVELTQEARDEYLDAMFRHRYGETCTVPGSDQ